MSKSTKRIMWKFMFMLWIITRTHTQHIACKWMGVAYTHLAKNRVSDLPFRRCHSPLHSIESLYSQSINCHSSSKSSRRRIFAHFDTSVSRLWLYFRFYPICLFKLHRNQQIFTYSMNANMQKIVGAEARTIRKWMNEIYDQNTKMVSN